MLMGKMLFWPGRGKSAKILQRFLAFISAFYDISIFPFDYDTGGNPFYSESSWSQWIKNNHFDWWCGISLGASLSYVMASLSSKPSRITMINPFQSRSILAEEKGFSIENQWDFSLSNYTINVENLDMVLSIYDEKIPIYHGITILNKAQAKFKRLIFIEDTHCIECSENQIELANLLKKVEDGGRFDDRFLKHCYIYKQ